MPPTPGVLTIIIQATLSIFVRPSVKVVTQFLSLPAVYILQNVLPIEIDLVSGSRSYPDASVYTISLGPVGLAEVGY